MVSFQRCLPVEVVLPKCKLSTHSPSTNIEDRCQQNDKKKNLKATNLIKEASLWNEANPDLIQIT
jgi:hypothetical protein